MNRPIILIDGKNQLYRYGWVHRTLCNEEGRYTGALYGILDWVLRAKRRYPTARFAFVWDGAGQSWRHKYYAGYKANRGKDNPSDDVKRIRKQESLIQSACALLQIPSYVFPYAEADDVLAALAVRARSIGWQSIIYSGDRDFFQLLRYGVQIIRGNDTSDRLRLLRPRDVMDEFGCSPEDVLKVRALAGDKSDNIPNIWPKLGIKTAVKYIRAGVDPSKGVEEGCKNAPPEIRSKLEKAWPEVERNYRLMRLRPKFWKLKPVLRTFELDLATPWVQRRPNYYGLIKMLSELEMAELLEERQSLYDLHR